MTRGELLLPLCPFPPLAWWCLALEADARIDALEHYQKRSFRNRITLMTSRGVQTLTFPVERRGGLPRPQDQTRRAVNGDYRKVWQAIRTAYGRAPFFDEMAEGLEPLFLSGADTLGAWNRQTLHWAAEWLGVSVPPDSKAVTVGLSQHAYPLSDEGLNHRQLDGWPHVWDDRQHDIPYAALSIVDALMHLGPEAARRVIRIPRSESPRPE